MPEVTLAVLVTTHTESGFHRATWSRVVDTPFLPDVGDSFGLFPGDAWGLSGTIHRRKWDANGGVQLWFKHHVVDPPPDEKGHADYSPGHETSWYSREGDLNAMLESSGWSRDS